MVVDRRCKSFGSSDRTGVGGCRSQSGSNSAVSGWWEEGKNTGGSVEAAKRPTIVADTRYQAADERIHNVVMVVLRHNRNVRSN